MMRCAKAIASVENCMVVVSAITLKNLIHLQSRSIVGGHNTVRPGYIPYRPEEDPSMGSRYTAHCEIVVLRDVRRQNGKGMVRCFLSKNVVRVVSVKGGK